MMYGLCKRYEIGTEGKTPHELWREIHEAEERKKRETARRMGVEYLDDSEEELTHGSGKGNGVSLKGLPEHNADMRYKPKEGYIAGVKKGKPMTHAEANGKRVNPFYDSEYRDSGYSANCAMCVAAYEARRRGYDVRALPYQGKELEIALAADISFAYVGGKLQSPKGKGGKDFLEKTVKDNERYAFSFERFGSKNRHVIVAFRENGRLTVYDPQNSKIFNGEQIRRYLADKIEQRLLRIDNLEFNPEVINFIVKRR